MNIISRFSDRIIFYLPIVLFLATWEVMAFLIGNDRVPELWKLTELFFETAVSSPVIESQGGGTFGYLPHVAATLIHLLLGAGIGGVFGYVMAFVVYHNHLIGGIIEPLIEVIRVIPPLIVIPFILLIMGPTECGQISVGAFYAAFSLFIHTINALENIDRNYRLIAHIYGASKTQLIRTVEIPGILPELIGGIRVTIALTLGIVVVSEYLGSPSGIGRVLKFAISFSRVDLIVVGIIWSGIIGITIDLIVGTMRNLTITENQSQI